ncbi:hypothetical protein ACQ4M3_17205 [Leptolyngbya sp. AN03gr2]|uniref:hypothetical protein n=1 Tax=unclassified Leptolyngbya TaxID=2650499 RepID=UPI003D31E6D3
MTKRLEQAIARLKTLSTDKQDAIATLILNQLQEDDFEAIADQLADEFQQYVGSGVSPLSNDAVSRSGIYEEHP